MNIRRHTYKMYIYPCINLQSIIYPSFFKNSS